MSTMKNLFGPDLPKERPTWNQEPAIDEMISAMTSALIRANKAISDLTERVEKLEAER